MTAATVNPRMREVLDTPRGHRFSRPSHTSRPAPLTREQRLLAQMRDNPRVAYRLEHGTLPHWMRVAEERRKQAESVAKAASTTRTKESPAPRGGRHRAPRRRRSRSTLAYGVVLVVGVLLGQVVGLPL